MENSVVNISSGEYYNFNNNIITNNIYTGIEYDTFTNISSVKETNYPFTLGDVDGDNGYKFKFYGSKDDHTNELVKFWLVDSYTIWGWVTPNILDVPYWTFSTAEFDESEKIVSASIIHTVMKSTAKDSKTAFVSFSKPPKLYSEINDFYNSLDYVRSDYREKELYSKNAILPSGNFTFEEIVDNIEVDAYNNRLTNLERVNGRYSISLTEKQIFRGLPSSQYTFSRTFQIITNKFEATANAFLYANISHEQFPTYTGNDGTVEKSYIRLQLKTGTVDSTSVKNNIGSNDVVFQILSNALLTSSSTYTDENGNTTSVPNLIYRTIIDNYRTGKNTIDFEYSGKEKIIVGSVISLDDIYGNENNKFYRVVKIKNKCHPVISKHIYAQEITNTQILNLLH